MSDEKTPLHERLATQATLAALKKGVSEAADKALDAVETALFGKVGEAERVANSESGDALSRARARYGVGPDAEPAPPVVKPDPMAEAKKQLEAMKKQRAAAADAAVAPEAPEIKRTL